MTNEIDFLARTLWGEARGEGKEGMHPVANVIMNRVAAQSWYGTGVIGVVLKEWQFSVWNLSDPNRQKVMGVTKDDPVFVQALEIAKRAVAGDLPDITNGATHYYAESMDIPPDWIHSMTVTLVTHGHFFLKEKT